MDSYLSSLEKHKGLNFLLEYNVGAFHSSVNTHFDQVVSDRAFYELVRQAPTVLHPCVFWTSLLHVALGLVNDLSRT